ncbi:hypothetical protein F3P66_11040 [Agrobacterium fabrum]|uniref:Uncharacterized protein n=1 Tax=Agrobacterium fabrum (strain C58 / ATCC 33970) TaxID=176299 RepID=A8WFE5_AGRFC|nr:hypothetical protein Atu8056 [Agrobacterium fabrum str. C58]QRM60686.1 hypothetical protein F3P66_11040 [Agrobacterium fabrum]TRB31986.1 hypothetical protein EXN51_04185 [Agrobacterium fabrum]
MPFCGSGVASAPDGRHGLPISPASGIRKSGLRIALFSLPPMQSRRPCTETNGPNIVSFWDTDNFTRLVLGKPCNNDITIGESQRREAVDSHFSLLISALFSCAFSYLSRF